MRKVILQTYEDGGSDNNADFRPDRVGAYDKYIVDGFLNRKSMSN